MIVRKIKHTIGCLTILLLAEGCSFLDYDERSYNHKEDVFSDLNRTKSFLTDIYAYLPSDFGDIEGAMRASATDESEDVNVLSPVQRINEGSYNAINPIESVWGNMYSGIRATNLFLQETQDRNFEELYFNENYEELMTQFHNYSFEARFLRAFFYFELIKRYKNVPLITKVLSIEEAQNTAQASFEEVVEFIVNECEKVAQVLPEDYNNFTGAKETGRVTRGAALALKARVLLYAASPLFNESNDLQKWKDAAGAAKAIMDAGIYSLDPNFNEVVNNRASRELIFERREGNSNYFERRNFPIGYEGGNSGTCPTQNLVDAFEMATTGLPINDPNSGYNPADPYANRDSRLYATVLMNGVDWKGKTVETFEGGANARPKLNATKTGYYLKKYLIEAINLSPTNTSSREHVYVLFRLGEVILNYAEAMNEVYGPEDAGVFGMTALNAVNMLRSRANMPNFPAGLTKEEFREKLRNERRVELAFEDHRFWDVRRWKIGETTKDIYGMHITKESNGTLNYQKFLVEKRVYEARMNLSPIPFSELNRNSNLVQNTGW